MAIVAIFCDSMHYIEVTCRKKGAPLATVKVPRKAGAETIGRTEGPENARWKYRGISSLGRER